MTAVASLWIAVALLWGVIGFVVLFPLPALALQVDVVRCSVH